MDMNVSNLDICCLAYAKQFDQVKAKIDLDPDCVKQKDRVCGFFYSIVFVIHLILGWSHGSSLGLFKWCKGYCTIFT